MRLPWEHGQERGAFGGEFKAPVTEQLGQDVVTAGQMPGAVEEERGSDAAGGEDGKLSVAVGSEQQGVLRETGAGGEQGVELAGLLELVESSEGGEDPLAGAAPVPGVLDELEVLAGPGGFDAEEHGALANRDTMRIPVDLGKSGGKAMDHASAWHHVFRRNQEPPLQNKDL